ncbi:MAG: prolyl oligopeptidase family serine peptidase [Planctomycetota bacterium]
MPLTIRSPLTKLPWLPVVALLALLASSSSVLRVNVVGAGRAWADGPADNNPETVRRMPKLGIEVPADRRAALETELKKLADVVDQLRKKTDPLTKELWPDVAIFHKAVHDALKHQEFHQPPEVEEAFKLLALGLERGQQLLGGQAPWHAAAGLIVRGYVSKIDGSVQPYGIIVPASYNERAAQGYRLDLWFHGRGEVLTEVNFLRDRMKNPGTFAPPHTLVLHPYGRWNNAFKLAGEVDVMEALASVQQRYRVDEDRIGVRGFSMGGAGAWHLAVHDPGRWYAANPGAGFSETPEFLRSFQQETLKPKWWEQKLWHLYDCPDWAVNLRHCPTVAYSGDEDSQKQAADIMETALTKENLRLLHVIGPKTKHSYHPQSRDEVERRMTSLARQGRERTPAHVQFVTYTLKYNKLAWVTMDELSQHWEAARINARLDTERSNIVVTTRNLRGLTLDLAAGHCPFDLTKPVSVVIDGVTIAGPRPGTDRSWQMSLHRVGDAWRVGRRTEEGVRKVHDLQGPIDDAFMDSFLFVHPTGKAWHEPPAVWSDAELTRAVEQWRRHFRGDARVKEDRQIAAADIEQHNLVLWGDPSSNEVLAKIADRLPIRWERDAIVVNGKSYPSDRHALIAIFPNPLNPKKYVVLNSGFTFREYTHLNNARQIPVLPDWAVVDLSTPPGTIWPGKIVDAGFFDEQWQVKAGGGG